MNVTQGYDICHVCLLRRFQNVLKIIWCGGELALLGFARVSGSVKGQTPNVPMWAG
ncbi:MAG: hypothetical protein IPI50_12350 [Saprospiraceae bacterium]|nr:hypothetical protein [Saprospiraceae bacterium]